MASRAKQKRRPKAGWQETDDMTTPLWESVVSLKVDIEIGGIPAKTEKQALALIKAAVEDCLSARDPIVLWKKRGGGYQSFGKGKPALYIKAPDIMLGSVEAEVEYADEEDRGPW
jgi:hypothetical protein